MTDNLFVIIGAQRSGTSYLYNLLDQHPEIAMARPATPEPKFFLDEDAWLKGKEFYIGTFFRPDGTTQILGEKSTSYMESPEAGMRMKRLFPAVKIIVSLRNPVFRALSNFYFSAKNGLERRTLREAMLGLKAAPPDFTTSVSPFDYLGRGEYAKYLKPYLDMFQRQNVKVIIFSRLAGRLWAIQDLYAFLGVDPSFEPLHIDEAVNASDAVQPVDPDVIQFLQDYYRPQIADLEGLLDTRLDEWTS
jgi:sulfotransferase family protein